jgi:hypothetical protein
MSKVKKGKLIADWSRNKDTLAFLAALSAYMGIPILELVISVVGGDHSGSWIHPEAAIHLAMWLDAHFAVEVISWTSRFISGDLTLVHDLVERHEAVNAGTRVLATVTTAGADISCEAHELLHQDNARGVKDAANCEAEPTRVDWKHNNNKGSFDLDTHGR